MIDAKRGDERIMRVTEIDGERASWVDEGELVRCADCVYWGAMDDLHPPDYCPVVRKCTRHGGCGCCGSPWLNTSKDGPTKTVDLYADGEEASVWIDGEGEVTTNGR